MFVVSCKFGREREIYESLKDLGYEVYLPETKLLKNKIFVRTEDLETLQDELKKLRAYLVRFNDRFDFLNQEEIRRIVENDLGNPEKTSEIKIGDRVKVLSGIFNGYLGTVEEDLDGRHFKVKLSLDLKSSNNISVVLEKSILFKHV